MTAVLPDGTQHLSTELCLAAGTVLFMLGDNCDKGTP